MIVREFVSRKLQLIADDLHRLDAFRDLSYNEVIADPIRLAAIERMVRNVLVHEYNDADHQLVYRSIRTALTDYPVYVSAIDEYLTREHGV